jgi:vacuolar-type H+-ATPase subunit I/STV1
VQETDFKAKGKHEVKEQDKNEEPSQWFAEFMKAAQRIQQKVDSTIEEIDDLKKKDIVNIPEIEDVLKSEKDDNGNDNSFKD